MEMSHYCFENGAVRIEVNSFRQLLPELHKRYGVARVTIVPSPTKNKVLLADTPIGCINSLPHDYKG